MTPARKRPGARRRPDDNKWRHRLHTRPRRVSSTRYMLLFVASKNNSMPTEYCMKPNYRTCWVQASFLCPLFRGTNMARTRFWYIVHEKHHPQLQSTSNIYVDENCVKLPFLLRNTIRFQVCSSCCSSPWWCVVRPIEPNKCANIEPKALVDKECLAGNRHGDCSTTELPSTIAEVEEFCTSDTLLTCLIILHWWLCINVTPHY